MRSLEEGRGRRKRPASATPGISLQTIITWILVFITVAALLFQISMYERMSWSAELIEDDFVGYKKPKRLGSTNPFVFLHIPKAAGTTITESMKDVFDHACQDLGFKNQDSFEYAKAQGRLYRQIVETYISKGIPMEQARDRVNRWHDIPCFYAHAVAGPQFDARQMLMDATMFSGTRVRYILGHVPFGFCEFAEAGCVYVTVLREPMSRLYSHYKYMMRMYPEDTRKMCRGMCEDFAGYVLLASENRAGLGMDNMQTRMIAGDGFWATVSRYQTCINGLNSCDILAPSMVTRETLEQAKRNLLNHFAVVATMEHLSVFKKMMQAVFGMTEEKGWGSWEMNKFNDNKEAKKDTFSIDELDPETRRKFNEFQRYDIELYDFATKLMFKQYADMNSLMGERHRLAHEWNEKAVVESRKNDQPDSIDRAVYNLVHGLPPERDITSYVGAMTGDEDADEQESVEEEEQKIDPALSQAYESQLTDSV